jgi:hypothetical protein
MRSRAIAALLLSVAALLLSVAATGAHAASADCNRDCLKKITQQYLDAVVKHTPSAASLATTFRYTENAVEMTTNEGLWKTSSRLGQLQRIYVDPAQNQSVFFGLIEEGGQPAIVSLRLRVTNRKISEAEAIVGRKGISLFDAQNLIDHPPSDQPVAKALHTSRKEMIAAAASYFDGAQSQNPAIVQQKPGCDRYENGVKTTHRPGNGTSGLSTEQDCAGSLAQMKQIAGVVNRRFIVVDEEAGVVAATAIFNRPPGAKRADGTLWPRLLFTEFFPIEKGKFTAIYAAMFYLPADAKDSGWDK